MVVSVDVEPFDLFILKTFKQYKQRMLHELS